MSFQRQKVGRHLRLVHDRTKPEIHLPIAQMQLTLPLSIPHNIIVVDVSNFRYLDLENTIAFVQPRWVFDFRKIARFDKLAGNRSNAFRIFKSYGSGYADMLGMFRRGLPFKEMTRVSLWRRVFGTVIRRDNRFEGPFLILSEDLEQFSQLSQYITAALRRSTGANYGVSFLPENFIQRAGINYRNAV